MKLFLLFLHIAYILAFKAKNFGSKLLKSSIICKQNTPKIFFKMNMKSLPDKDTDEVNKEIYLEENNQRIEGYINMDLNKNDDGKQSRVFIYIVFAILPCLLLVPFMMSRNFVPQGGF